MESQELTINPGRTPEEVAKEMKAELYKRAKGYDIEEKIVTEGPQGTIVTTKTKHIPGDARAMVEYIRLFGTDNGGWS